MTRRVSVDALRTFYQTALASFGVGGPAADAVGSHLLEADVMCVDSNGLQQWPGYAASLASGRIRAQGSPRILEARGALALIDGDGAFGQWVGEVATKELIARAQAHGIALVAAKNSN